MDKLFDFKKSQKRWNQKWSQSGVFTADADSERQPFVIILPPPNVTGVLTVGHVLGASVMDLLVRWKRMSGFNSLWLPGTDHAGIATQKVVENQLLSEGKQRTEMGREEFLSHCWEWKDRHHARIVEQLNNLGCALDWSRECFTLDEERSRAVREVFVRLYEKGLIYRGNYIVNWCPSCGTAISDEEVFHQEKDAKLYWIRYPMDDGSHVTVATTRPETMLGDTAVAVNPDDESKRPLVGKTATLPLIGRKLPVIADPLVDREFGSGFVKVTPAHDPNDFDMGERHGLDHVFVINREGKMTADAGKTFAGLDRFECRRKVLHELEEQGLLEKIEPYHHSVGLHDRCKTVIEPLLSREWFVKMKPLAEPALRAVNEGEIELYPPRWKNVYLNWMHNIRDWCISRQLWWGHRIPVWYCAKGHLTVTRDDPLRCRTCGSKELTQEEDVLDTWFSSWLWTFSPLGWPDDTKDLETFHPTSVLVTAPDIIFFWVARMIMAALEFKNEIPFKHVFFTGIVRDMEGRKMSKSLGNSPDPLHIINKFGSDAFRFTLSMLSPPGKDVFFAEKKLEMGRNFINKIWQASRMVLGAYESHEEDLWAASKNGATEFSSCWNGEFPRALAFEPNLEWEDRWILHALSKCAGDVDDNLSSWRLNDAAARLYDFFWHDYCDWYLELAKIRLYGEADSRPALSVLLYVLAQSLKLLHPFIPYASEELWDKLPMTKGLLLEATYPRKMSQFEDEEGDKQMQLFRDAVTAVRNIRAQYRINPAARIRVQIKTPKDGEESFHIMSEGIMQLAKVESLEIGPDIIKEKGSAASPIGLCEVIVPLVGVIDLDEEMRRLDKEKQKLESDLARTDRKLSNEDFLSKAKESVVTKEREKKSLLETELEKIVESLRIISGAD
jgi:valyl-tRNA synthetase